MSRYLRERIFPRPNCPDVCSSSINPELRPVAVDEPKESASRDIPNEQNRLPFRDREAGSVKDLFKIRQGSSTKKRGLQKREDPTTGRGNEEVKN